jgi:hypothetical protein
MSCDRCAHQTAAQGVLAASPGQVHAVFARPNGRVTPQCPLCRAWYNPAESCQNPRCPTPGESGEWSAGRTEQQPDSLLPTPDSLLPTPNSLLPPHLHQAAGVTPAGNDADILGNYLIPDGREDLLCNEFLERVYSDMATAVARTPRQVHLAGADQPVGFATDMNGHIYAHAYPLGVAAPPAHNVVVAKAGIYHEFAHEEFTDQQTWFNIIAIGQSAAPLVFDVSDQRVRPEKEGEYLVTVDRLRPLTPTLFNIIEDGRIERELSRQYPGAGEILAAACRLDARWDEAVGDAVPTHHQLMGAMLYTALPYYQVRPEIEARLHPDAKELLDRVAPIIRRAVNGEQRDVYQAVLIISDILERSGIIPATDAPSEPAIRATPPGRAGSAPPAVPPEELPGFAGKLPPTGETSQTAGGSGAPGSSGPSAGDANNSDRRPPATNDGRSSGAATDAAAGQGSEPAAPAEDDGRAGGSPHSGGSAAGAAYNPAASAGVESSFAALSDEDVDEIARRAAQEAADAIRIGRRKKYSPKSLARELHRPRQPTRKPNRHEWDVAPSWRVDKAPVVYLDAGGKVRETETRIEAIPAAVRATRERAVALKSSARQMAKYLGAVRHEVEQQLHQQREGRLDRRRLVAAVKGSRDIRAQSGKVSDTSLAASINFDMSGSMGSHVDNGSVTDVTLTMGMAFEELGVDYEVRGFAMGDEGQDNLLVKSVGDAQLDFGRVARLKDMRNLGRTENAGVAAAVAATSLHGAESANKLLVMMTDGALSPEDQAQASQELAAARKNGLVTFGLFLNPLNSSTMLNGHTRQEVNVAEMMNDLYGPGNWASIIDLTEMPMKVGKRIANIFAKLGVKR